MPNKKLLSKTSVGSKTEKKYDKPKTPYQRLLASPHVTEDEKAHLSRLYDLYNPVTLQHTIHKVVSKLLAAYSAKVTFSI
jgi:hypothetical protein